MSPNNLVHPVGTVVVVTASRTIQIISKSPEEMLPGSETVCVVSLALSVLVAVAATVGKAAQAGETARKRIRSARKLRRFTLLHRPIHQSEGDRGVGEFGYEVGDVGLARAHLPGRKAE